MYVMLFKNYVTRRFTYIYQVIKGKTYAVSKLYCNRLPVILYIKNRATGKDYVCFAENSFHNKERGQRNQLTETSIITLDVHHQLVSIAECKYGINRMIFMRIIHDKYSRAQGCHRSQSWLKLVPL